MQVKIRWDYVSGGESGWVIEFPNNRDAAPSPKYYHLKRQVSARKLAEMVRATARYEGITLPREFELVIQN